MGDQRVIWKDAWDGLILPPSPFARRCLRDWLPGGTALDIVELGCGSGADASFFARHGHRVIALDFSESAVAATIAQASQRGLVTLTARQEDYTQLPLTLADGACDVVYSHLSLHYFPDALTRAIIADLGRVLRPNGLFCVKCKSTADPLYGLGEAIGPDTFALRGHVRHFFSKSYLAALLAGWSILRLRRSTATYDGARSAFVEAVARRSTSIFQAK